MARLKTRLWFLLPCAAVVLSAVAGGAAAVTPTFPLKVHAANGAVTIPKRPSRIISLSATGTEDLYAVGAGKQVG